MRNHRSQRFFLISNSKSKKFSQGNKNRCDVLSHDMKKCPWSMSVKSPRRLRLCSYSSVWLAKLPVDCKACKMIGCSNIELSTDPELNLKTSLSLVNWIICLCLFFYPLNGKNPLSSFWQVPLSCIQPSSSICYGCGARLECFNQWGSNFA